MHIGIVSTGLYIPSHYMTAEEISEASGVPLHVVKDKMGITKKPIPGPDDHTVQMGIWSAKMRLKEVMLIRNPLTVSSI